MILENKSNYRLDDKVLIKCDFNISTKCKGSYYKCYKNILNGRANNNGKDMCCYCFNTSTKSGNKNYNFKFNKNENYFENIETELQAYLLGWIAGDGYVRKDGLKLEIHKDDIEILELFKKSLVSDTPIKNHKVDNTVIWFIHSVKLVKDILLALKLNKVGKKSHKIVLPDLDDSLIWHFIRGLIDSDGAITSPYKQQSPTISYCSISLKIKNQIIKLCSANNIATRRSGFSIVWNGDNALKLIEKIYDNSIFFLIRKRDRADIYKTWKYRQGNSVNRPKRKYLYNHIGDIKTMLNNGIPQPVIAKTYGVSSSAISSINTNRTYKKRKRNE